MAVTASSPRKLERLKALLGSRSAAVVVLALILAAIWLLAYVQGISGQRLLSLAVRGMMLSGIVALGAIGLTLVFGVVKFANFAHGDLMTLGAYLALPIVAQLGTGSVLGPFAFGWEMLLALAIAMPITGLAAYAIDWVIYRPLRARRSSTVILAMASLGMAFFVRSLIYLIWGADFVFYYRGRARPATVTLFADIRVRPDQLFILGLAIALVALVYVLLEKTKIGKAMRATADNPDLARISGINTQQIILWTWLIGGGLAAAGGIMFGLDSQLRPEMGWFLLLPLFAAVILGSIGNPYGALVGALVISVAQQMATAFINPAYAPGVAFVILILLLLFRPQGLFGKGG
jgi:branched-chain amino acid transport system permease protein/neutral amino acid transport system permease protein